MQPELHTNLKYYLRGIAYALVQTELDRVLSSVFSVLYTAYSGFLLMYIIIRDLDPGLSMITSRKFTVIWKYGNCWS